MARANRVQGGGFDGGVFHITPRCHNREFLLKFARDRDSYREKLREHLGKYEVWLLDYCVTCNHAHLLVDAEDRLVLSGFMQEVDDPVVLRRNLEASLVERITGDQMQREPDWTESLAVGSAEFVWRAKPLILSRRQTTVAEGVDGSWVLQESVTRYGQKTR